MAGGAHEFSKIAKQLHLQKFVDTPGGKISTHCLQIVKKIVCV